MNADQYINGIVRKIKCGGEKKKEIRKQLFADINFRLEQGKMHYAVGEVTVSYENVSVVYRMTYNTDMQLAGLYMR